MLPTQQQPSDARAVVPPAEERPKQPEPTVLLEGVPKRRNKAWVRAYNAAYRKRNKETLRVKKRQYAEAHRAEIVARHNRWRANNLAHTREYDRNYYRQHQEQITARFRARYATLPKPLPSYSTPFKVNSRAKFKRAVNQGRIVRPKHCQGCGKPCTPEGHHADYSKPMDVVWLCDSCHGEQHRKPLPETIEITRLP